MGAQNPVCKIRDCLMGPHGAIGFRGSVGIGSNKHSQNTEPLVKQLQPCIASDLYIEAIAP